MQIFGGGQNFCEGKQCFLGDRSTSTKQSKSFANESKFLRECKKVAREYNFVSECKILGEHKTFARTYFCEFLGESKKMQIIEI